MWKLPLFGARAVVDVQTEIGACMTKWKFIVRPAGRRFSWLSR